MARYEINSRTFMAGQLLEPGLIVTLPDDYLPGWHLTPIDEAAEAAYARYEATLPASLRPKEAPAPLDISVEDPGPDTRANEVDLRDSLAGSATTQATPGLTEANAKPVAPSK